MGSCKPFRYRQGVNVSCSKHSFFINTNIIRFPAHLHSVNSYYKHEFLNNWTVWSFPKNCTLKSLSFSLVQVNCQLPMYIIALSFIGVSVWVCSVYVCVGVFAAASCLDCTLQCCIHFKMTRQDVSAGSLLCFGFNISLWLRTNVSSKELHETDATPWKTILFQVEWWAAFP